jgi:MFS family permease
MKPAVHDLRSGFIGFTIAWIGQAASLLGSTMTWFALSIWTYELTGQATALALLSFFSFGPTLLLSPVAGVLVDRWNRKTVLILSDLLTGTTTIVVLILYLTGYLQIWHLYLVGFLSGVFQAFQYPAYSAAVTMMVPKEHYVRTSGMVELAGSASGVLAPLLAGVLLGFIGVAGIMTLDVVTLVLAISTLALVHIPQPPVTEAGLESRGGIWEETLYGFRYIAGRPSLLGLQLLFAAGNLIDYAGYVLIAPMILARTGGDELVLGTVQSAGAMGAVVGGLLLSLWGGPKRRMHGVLIGWALASLGMIALGIGEIVVVWTAASFFYFFFEPIIDGSDQAIWQAKVAPDVQGRVFGTQLLISHCTIPIAALLAGPLADFVFEPAMMPGGGLADTFGWLVGVGPGAGMALMIVLAGILQLSIPLVGYAWRAIRDVETVLPDHDAVPSGLAL